MSTSSENKAVLSVDGRSVELGRLTGSTGERALDLSQLKAQTGCMSFDPGMANTAVCRSAITFVDGERGILLHRGYSIEDLTANSSFIEVAYLLIHGILPTERQQKKFSSLLNFHSMLHEDMRSFFGKYPEGAHPMAVLSAMVVSLSSFYPELRQNGDKEEIDTTVARLLSKLRTIAAFSYKKSIGEPYVYPSHKYSYCENFLNMMFNSPVSPYKASDEDVRLMNQLLILHADHEQNASTTAVRMVGSTGANLYACISAGVCALWGPLHGGANQAVVEMLDQIQKDGLTADQVVARAKDKNDPFKLMGFGHRIYKSYDPRAKIAKKLCTDVLSRKNLSNAMVDTAMALEERALQDPYFQERNLYPNVDFYTGLIYQAMGFPKEMYPVLFALGRLPGWIAHWQEMRQDSEQKLLRPRQIYTGPGRTDYVPTAARG
ncbi:MAG: citrate synthase [Kiritimatiellia bacterium]|jgi:citrate synthase|nr:citrate synthase [Kiritimatiellia bacterium]